MKKQINLLLIACFTLFSVSVMAQKQLPSAETIAKNVTDKMAKSLSLTKDQIPQIQTINEDYAKKALDLYKQYAGNKTELEKQAKESNASREVALRKVFTDQQYNKYLQKKSEFEVKKQQAIAKTLTPPVQK